MDLPRVIYPFCVCLGVSASTFRPPHSRGAATPPPSAFPRSLSLAIPAVPFLCRLLFFGREEAFPPSVAPMLHGGT